MLIARIYEAFPLLRPICGGQMRIIAFITYSTYSADNRHILEHIGAEACRRASPRHADRHFGTEPMRQLVRAWSQRQSGAKNAKLRLTLRLISASAGEGKNSETDIAAGQAVPDTAQNASNRPISGNWP